MTFGERLKHERLRLDMSQDVISGLCDISRQAWNAYENNKRLPSMEHLMLMSQNLKLDMNYLLDVTEARH